MAEKNLNNEEILRMASEKLGINKDTVKNAASNKENLLNRLSGEDREKVSKVLSDKELTRQVLSSPKAQELIKKFFGEQKNGN